MSFYRKVQWLGVGIVFLIVGVSGCISSPSPRMSAVLGIPMDKRTATSQPVIQWLDHQTIGLIAFSDATGPDAAPAISPSLLSRLSQRAKVYLEQHCVGPKIQMVSFNGDKAIGNPSSIINIARDHHVESLVIALFSSTETTQPATFGEARMMTQMPGTTTHNSALVELGIVDVTKGVVGIQTFGKATESLDRLTVPIGNDQLSFEEALDILRANAGQQALDDALQEFTQGCVTT